MPAYDGRYEAELRPFLDAMRVKLMANAYKGKWEGLSMEGLFTLLTSEVQELHDAVLRGNLMEVQLEAADVANFALMVANVAMRGAATGQGSDDRQMSLFPDFADGKPENGEDQESNYVMQGAWAPHEGTRIRMWKSLDTGIVVYDDHPISREKKLRIASWRVGSWVPGAE